jgi:RNA polymerase sigma-70 factor (ECF subfamily)
MEPPRDLPTQISLLNRLRDPTDAGAWHEFVRRYGPVLRRWCLRWHLQDADAQDVTQLVLLKLATGMREFRYDRSGSFRGWLWTVTHNVWQDYELKERRRQSSGAEDDADRLNSLEAPADLAKRLEQAFDLELLEMAMARVRLRVEPRTWDAFRMLAQDGLSGAEVAKKLGMKVATAFVARSKVQKMIQDELAALDPDRAE